MLPKSNYGGDGDQSETNTLKSPTTFSELVHKKVMTLISELPKKLHEWRTQINEEPKQKNVKPCDLLELDKFILPKALTESLMALEKSNKEFAETIQQTVMQCEQLKNSIDVLSLKVHNLMERDKLRKLPLSHIENSRVTFTSVAEEESKCDHTEQAQLKDRFEELPLKVQNKVECKEPVQLLPAQIADNKATFIYTVQKESKCDPTEKKDRFVELPLKVQNLVECEKSVHLLPPQIDDSQTTCTCLNKEESNCDQTEKQQQFHELTLEVHKKATRGELSHLPSPQIDASQATFICIDQEENNCDQSTKTQENKKLDEREELMELPPSRANDSQATFTCVEVEESKRQLYNNLLNKFQRNAFDTSLENKPSKLIISKTVTKFRPPYSKFFSNMSYVWDFSSSSHSLTEDVVE